ncbi:PepSY domain-containing protein [Mesorhizobium sp. J428]|uniref:PepSY domain-containing protein n=1 Tax=Mesorhizobium sp. J428 TaxID=2898440 RepID=UPI00215189FF|nr:PepSY domain-containing protein [Mesorhizobium sp. J428]MCR5856531.1 PepSY domain-containing protein [Mesorhizobium sp. J428]
MNRIAFILTLAAAPFVASAAMASPSCGNQPQSSWKSLAEIEAKATEMGYKVREIDIEDGCYEIYAIDKDGKRVEAYLNPVTAEVVEAKIDD